MNTRIDGIVASVLANLDLDEQDSEKSPVQQFTDEFAKAIVRECLSEVTDEVQFHTNWDIAEKVSNRVKKHFGVE